jgi:hypothetical protein
VHTTDTKEENDHRGGDIEPVGKVMNVPRDGNDKAFVRNRNELIARSQMESLGRAKGKAREYEQTMNKGERLHKRHQSSLFDLDFKKEEREHMPYSIVFETVMALEKEKKLMREYMKKKQELEDTVINGIGKGVNPINEE